MTANLRLQGSADSVAVRFPPRFARRRPLNRVVGRLPRSYA
jgi:hypothetical protein